MDTEVPLNGLSLKINSPIDDDRLDLIIGDLAADQPASIADIGCGWAEILLRLLAAVPTATGIGIDQEAVDIERAQELAARRGLEDRVRLIVADASLHKESHDLVICSGAHHVYGDSEQVADALRELRMITNDGGRLLFGVDYWLSAPPPERLQQMWGGASLADSRFLPDVVDAAQQTGWRLLDLYEVSQQEWNDYECGLVRNQEEWLLGHHDHPAADQLRERLDTARNAWLRGHHSYLGFAWLTLGALPRP